MSILLPPPQSAFAYEQIVSGKITPAIAAEYLKNGRVIKRSFAETLKQMYPEKDLTPRLVDFFLADAPDANPQSVSRKIRNWTAGKNEPADRADIFRIAFALNLQEQQLNSLLCLCSDYCIQYGDHREVILTWFLRNGYTYPQALSFLAGLPPVPEQSPPPNRHTSGLTHKIQSAFQNIKTLGELKDCYMENLSKFGTMHLRAYYYFDKYLDLLIRPAPNWDDNAPEPDYSLETVMETYLSLQVPPGRNRTGYTVVQKLLKQNWPNATSIKKIRSRKEDVPRKLLLLLYVVTENETAITPSYSDIDEDYLTLEERVEFHWQTLNAILEDRGMASLDPQNAMDWLILYVMSATPEESMSERLAQVMTHTFDSHK